MRFEHFDDDQMKNEKEHRIRLSRTHSLTHIKSDKKMKCEKSEKSIEYYMVYFYRIKLQEESIVCERHKHIR